MQRKKNKLLVAVTTTKIFEYKTDAETADIALDEFYNDTAKKLKLFHNIGNEYSIQDFTVNKPTKGKK